MPAHRDDQTPRCYLCGRRPNESCSRPPDGGCVRNAVVIPGPGDIPTQGIRLNVGKPPMSLLPFDALRAVAEISAQGAKKYSPRNWEQGMPFSFMVDAMLRHLERLMAGETHDAESGQPHTGHIAWNALSLLAYTLRPHLAHSHFNDLPKAMTPAPIVSVETMPDGRPV